MCFFSAHLHKVTEMVPDHLAKLPDRARYAGDSSKGEAEIIPPPGESADMDPTGILLQDEFHTVVRDAVRYPSGAIRSHMRVIGATAVDGVDGVVVLAGRASRHRRRGKFLACERSRCVLGRGGSKRWR